MSDGIKRAHDAEFRVNPPKKPRAVAVGFFYSSKLLQGFIDHKINGHWSNVVLKLMSAHYSGGNDKPIKKFDSMLRVHDAAVFRHLGVTR